MTESKICTCPSGDGSLVHPCPAHPAVEQVGGDERDFQAEGAQEVPSPVSQEYDRHLISLLRKGEALPGHQAEEYCACAWSTSFPTECYRITADLRVLLNQDKENGNG